MFLVTMVSTRAPDQRSNKTGPWKEARCDLVSSCFIQAIEWSPCRVCHVTGNMDFRWQRVTTLYRKQLPEFSERGYAHFDGDYCQVLGEGAINYEIATYIFVIGFDVYCDDCLHN